MDGSNFYLERKEHMLNGVAGLRLDPRIALEGDRCRLVVVGGDDDVDEKHLLVNLVLHENGPNGAERDRHIEDGLE
jgi:hypothetical protein